MGLYQDRMMGLLWDYHGETRPYCAVKGLILRWSLRSQHFPASPFPSKGNVHLKKRCSMDLSFKNIQKKSPDSLYFTLAIIWLANSSPSYRYIYIYADI